MCGIFGVVSARGPIDVPGLVRASTALKHRGPDAEGVLLRGEAGTKVLHGPETPPEGAFTLGLAHRRLAILDLPGGKQPLSNEDGSVWCVFNGQIYNHLTLRNLLAEQGHVFRTRSDTEVLCHGWEEWGISLVRRLEGIFAFCIYDARRDVLVLFRDHAGVKPLYYYVGDGVFAFASEVKAILAYAPAVKVCRESVFDFFLFDQVPRPRTPFRSVFKLDAGELCVVRCRDAALEEKTKYWDFTFRPAAWKSRDDIVAAVEETLRRVVAKQAVADVPVATLLSGGIDSSLVTHALMTQSHDLTAFHMYSTDRWSERRWTANAGFNGLNRVNVPYAPTLQDCRDALANIDALLFDPGILPMHLVALAVSQAGYKVVLSGDGGDELFAGYDVNFYPAYLFERYRPLGIRVWGRSRILRHVIGAGHAEQLERYCRRNSYLDVYSTRINNLVSVRKVDAAAARARLPADDPLVVPLREELTGLERLSYFYCRNVMNVILEKVDLGSMANSLEVRVPLLDVEMMELALSIPFEDKIRGRGKYPLKAIAAKHFGREFAYRLKQGFGFDISRLFLDPEIESYLRRSLANEGVADFLDVPGIVRLIEENRSQPVHGKVLWRVLMFTEWHRNWGVRFA